MFLGWGIFENKLQIAYFSIKSQSQILLPEIHIFLCGYTFVGGVTKMAIICQWVVISLQRGTDGIDILI